NTVNQDGLIGTLVTATQPVVVNCGSANGSFYNGNGRDYGIDQIVGADKIGNEYIVVKGDGENDWENILVVGHENTTAIYLNGSTTATATINAGEYYLIEGDQYSSHENLFIESSKNCFVYQGVGATNSEANQGMFFVPPLSCENRGDVNNIALIDEIGETAYAGGISIVVKNGATTLINGADIDTFSGTGPGTVIGKPDYVTYKITGLTGNIHVESTDELYCAYFNFNGAATSGSFYSGFPSAPEINFEVDLSALGNCIPNITLAVANIGNFDSIEWEYDDGSGSGFQATGSSSPNLTPSNPGTYRLRGRIDCSGLELVSHEIPVSICPDDSDNDGIIDNLDLDNDNDGILNCDESKGEGIIDLSDLVQPQVSFASDGTVDSGIATGTYTQSNSSGSTNTFGGSSNGSFVSAVNSAADSQGVYTLSFTESVHIAFRPQTGLVHTVTEGEWFVAKVFPADKNITVLDPDNQLLIDTDYDGVFKTGVQQFTANEIYFKISETPDGNTPYAFAANQVEGFSFEHHLTNPTSDASYEGVISLSCFDIDTDADDLPDAYDLDSDGDGCYDTVEAGFTDGDDNGILGIDPIIPDEQGRVLNQGGYTPPLSNPIFLYYFQVPGQAPNIDLSPTSESICENDPAQFTVTASGPDTIRYQWQVFEAATNTWNNLTETATYSGVTTANLVLSNVGTELNGDQYRVLVSSESYLCASESGVASLSVNTIPDPPIVTPIQTFCQTDTPTVGDLTIAPSNPTGLTVEVYDDYDPSDSAVGNLLPPATALIDGQTYYMQAVNAEDCTSETRSQTKALLSNPIITASAGESCEGDTVDISVEGVPQTALDFENQNPTLTKILTHNNSTYFVDPVKRTFTETEDLMPTYGNGASLYQINNLAEHDAVWAAIVANGFLSEPLWLGLKQFPSLNPTNAFDEGWYWLDGRPWDSSWDLWEDDEPNDYDFNPNGLDSDGVDDGSEDYGHFNLNQSKLLNDYPGDITSRPLYEFSGTTTVAWFYEESSNPGTLIPIVSNTTSITVQPSVTTTYYIEVTTNGVTCTTSYTQTVNPKPEANTIPDHVLCDDDLDGDGNNGSITLSQDDI
ncbi:MAG: hypothetical protein QGH06_07035, partial [Lutibacter sp.]|nr:hypothetical protein [Lutibacter sp.]